jgi:glutaredoxin 3
MVSTGVFLACCLLICLLSNGLGFISVKKFVGPRLTVGGSGVTQLQMTSGQEQQQQLGRVTIYKKESCPYCKKARELLEGKYGLAISYVDVETAEGDKKEEILHQMRTFSGGRNTVPQIFFNSEHVGGNDDVQKLEAEGKLSALVDNVRKTETFMQDGWYHPWY